MARNVVSLRCSQVSANRHERCRQSPFFLERHASAHSCPATGSLFSRGALTFGKTIKKEKGLNTREKTLKRELGRAVSIQDEPNCRLGQRRALFPGDTRLPGYVLASNYHNFENCFRGGLERFGGWHRDIPGGQTELQPGQGRDP